MPKIKATINGSINKGHMIYIYQYMVYFNMYNLLICIHYAIVIKRKLTYQSFHVTVFFMRVVWIFSLQISRVQWGILNKKSLRCPYSSTTNSSCTTKSLHLWKAAFYSTCLSSPWQGPFSKCSCFKFHIQVRSCGVYLSAFSLSHSAVWTPRSCI